MNKMEKLNKILDFIIEIEKLKAVLRKSRPVGLERYENAGEHSWHVALSALLLKDYSNEEVDINHVIKMLLIHDLGEIDAGDKIVYSSESDKQKTEEENGIKRILAILPENMRNEYLLLWKEFEAGITPESKFAKAVDRVPPLLHNIHDNGHGWKKNNISKEKVFALNSQTISAGSNKLWHSIEEKLNQAVAAGTLQ